ncbi:Signal peptidase complex subunit 2 [Hondaea fermentalgiana]|uniref:Signal peptidase complex subunit 2 n=1 Tax=Hondaea fermentalgiana TaxID=2315210 RepID=A0A2R5GI10_9STRA|nr:Signal peptidase complex subunit 2 [Hondaea fermentalgiana]|eukprot:GBG30530.1 Signal peptidase complex subunit 2 [Hondaea fermentalgiana]
MQLGTDRAGKRLLAPEVEETPTEPAVDLVDADDAPVPPVDVLDQLAVKRTVDDCIYKLLEIEGYKENLLLSNVKLGIMTSACCVALYAQLGPHKFPEDKAILTACVVFYAVASAILQVIATFIEKDYIVRTRAKEGLPGSELLVSTFMDRGDEMIKVRLECAAAIAERTVEYSSSVGKYFSPEGELDEVAVQSDLCVCLEKLERSLKQSSHKKDI